MFAEGDVLKSIARERGVDDGGSDEEIRSRLFQALELEEVEVKVDEESNDEKVEYSLQILNSDSLKENNGTVILDGNVSISFSYGDEKPKTLSSSTLILDTENKKITALGNVVFIDGQKDAAIQEIKADVFTLLWEKGDFVISGGTTETTRKNSEEESVSFFTTGETLSYSSSGYMLYDKGYITSNPRDAYSSISASRIAILPGEDMFMSSMFFNIGRVPMFYLPFFFYPGSSDTIRELKKPMNPVHSLPFSKLQETKAPMCQRAFIMEKRKMLIFLHCSWTQIVIWLSFWIVFQDPTVFLYQREGSMPP